jgi:hypothetical protein
MLLMWVWPVKEMTELVSGMPAPKFYDESSWVRGLELVQGSSGSFFRFDIRCVRVFPKMCSRTPGGTRTQGWRPLQ